MTEKLEVNELDNMAGGNAEEYKELKRFIKKVDPNFKPKNTSEVMRWLDRNSGLDFKSMSIGAEYGDNEFVLKDGRVLNNDELLEILREKYNV